MKLKVTTERWSITGGFTISRGTMTHSNVLVVELEDNGFVGRGECEPHESNIEEMNKAAEQIESLREVIELGLSREGLQKLLPAGPIRNAIDCALWDLDCKKQNKSIWSLTGVTPPVFITTAFTISLASAATMQMHALKNRKRPLLKLKLGSENCIEKVQAVRLAAPASRLIVDANEAFTFSQLQAVAPVLATMGVELIEQPLPAGNDEALEGYTSPVPLCADESCLDRSSLSSVKNRYQYINIKLDKTGGLTEALALAEEARNNKLGVMVGCMTGTSLAMAPAMVIGSMAEFCDLDGPLLLDSDRKPALVYEGSFLYPPSPEVWG